MRADELFEAGDFEGEAIWRAILRTVAARQRAALQRSRYWTAVGVAQLG